MFYEDTSVSIYHTLWNSGKPLLLHLHGHAQRFIPTTVHASLEVYAATGNYF